MMTFPGPNLPMPGPDATGLTFDRADLDDTTPVPAGVETIPVGTRHPGAITVPDLPCGHLPGDVHDDECAYWWGVAAGDYEAPVIPLPPFNLRQLREQHTTAAQVDRGAA